MAYLITTATKKIHNLKKRIRGIQGGTSAGKTISTLQVLIDKAQRDTDGGITSIVSESFPHLKRGAMRDFKNIMIEHKYWIDNQWNATDSTYTFETGSKVEFFSADQPDKLRGARRDRAFINEANNISLDAFDQIEVRTKEFIFLDWNPADFVSWVYTVADNPKNKKIHSTYLNNRTNLTESQINAIEAFKDLPDDFMWKVYGLGQRGAAKELFIS